MDEINDIKRLKILVLNKVLDSMFKDVLKGYSIDEILDNTDNYFNDIQWYQKCNFNNVFMSIQNDLNEIVNNIQDDYYYNYLDDKEYKEFYIVDYVLNKFVDQNVDIIKKI